MCIFWSWLSRGGRWCPGHSSYERSIRQGVYLIKDTEPIAGLSLDIGDLRGIMLSSHSCPDFHTGAVFLRSCYISPMLYPCTTCLQSPTSTASVLRRAVGKISTKVASDRLNHRSKTQMIPS